MSQGKQCGISGGWLLTMLATALAMLLSMLGIVGLLLLAWWGWQQVGLAALQLGMGLC
mgnify:CR=1 FL=1